MSRLGLYRGVEGTVYLWHGEWSDPEVIYKNHLINTFDIEDGLWSHYNDWCDENGIEATSDGFCEWVTPDEVECQLLDIVWSQDECGLAVYVDNYGYPLDEDEIKEVKLNMA